LGFSSGFNISGGMGPSTGLGASAGIEGSVTGDRAVTTGYSQTEVRGGSGVIGVGIGIDHVKSSNIDGVTSNSMSYSVSGGGSIEMHEHRGFSQTYTFSDAWNSFKSAVCEEFNVNSSHSSDLNLNLSNSSAEQKHP
jgi:hypothetical protein